MFKINLCTPERNNRMINETIQEKEIECLYNELKVVIEQSRNRVYKTINSEIVDLHWNIGKMIIEKNKTEILEQNMVIY